MLLSEHGERYTRIHSGQLHDESIKWLEVEEKGKTKQRKNFKRLHQKLTKCMVWFWLNTYVKFTVKQILFKNTNFKY